MRAVAPRTTTMPPLVTRLGRSQRATKIQPRQQQQLSQQRQNQHQHQRQQQSLWQHQLPHLHLQQQQHLSSFPMTGTAPRIQILVSVCLCLLSKHIVSHPATPLPFVHAAHVGTGKTYFFNTVTGEVTWSKPQAMIDFEKATEAAKAAAKTASPTRRRSRKSTLAPTSNKTAAERLAEVSTAGWPVFRA